MSDKPGTGEPAIAHPNDTAPQDAAPGAPAPWTYRGAGVDVDAGNRAVELMKSSVRRTHRPEVLGDLGGFGGCFALEAGRYRQPVLVSGADGVGTKLRIAFAMDRHDTVGIDCVAMNVNDILVQGAEPLFFLDYLAVGRLDPERVAAVVSGVAEGCVRAGCALLGGETAEMPGFYAPGEYDLAGFAVGVADRERLLDGRGVRPGDAVVGLASSGLHSNGFSLARRLLLDAAGLGLEQRVEDLGRTLGEALLEPTRIYVKPVLSLLRAGRPLRALAHITGGGLVENIPRALPEGTAVRLRPGAWPEPPVFGLIRAAARRTGGGIAEAEMRRTFNLGLGMVAIVAPEAADAVVRDLTAAGEAAFIVGEVVPGERGVFFS